MILHREHRSRGRGAAGPGGRRREPLRGEAEAEGGGRAGRRRPARGRRVEEGVRGGGGGGGGGLQRGEVGGGGGLAEGLRRLLVDLERKRSVIESGELE